MVSVIFLYMVSSNNYTYRQSAGIIILSMIEESLVNAIEAVNSLQKSYCSEDFQYSNMHVHLIPQLSCFIASHIADAEFPQHQVREHKGQRLTSDGKIYFLRGRIGLKLGKKVERDDRGSDVKSTERRL